jgi:hypothetical protein
MVPEFFTRPPGCPVSSAFIHSAGLSGFSAFFHSAGLFCIAVHIRLNYCFTHLDELIPSGVVPVSRRRHCREDRLLVLIHIIAQCRQ